jgi:hypothetical protein
VALGNTRFVLRQHPHITFDFALVEGRHGSTSSLPSVCVGIGELALHRHFFILPCRVQPSRASRSSSFLLLLSRFRGFVS